MSPVGTLPDDPDGFIPSGDIAAPEGAAPNYPEHDRMASLRPKIEVVTEFLEWLGKSGYSVGEYEAEAFGDCYPMRLLGIERALSEYFKIDLAKIEDEKRAMLAALRKLNGVTDA